MELSRPRRSLIIIMVKRGLLQKDSQISPRQDECFQRTRWSDANIVGGIQVVSPARQKIGYKVWVCPLIFDPHSFFYSQGYLVYLTFRAIESHALMDTLDVEVSSSHPTREYSNRRVGCLEFMSLCAISVRFHKDISSPRRRLSLSRETSSKFGDRWLRLCEGVEGGLWMKAMVWLTFPAS